MGWLSNETLFYGGIAIIGITIVVTILSFFLFKIKKLRLDAKLNAEYGERNS